MTHAERKALEQELLELSLRLAATPANDPEAGKTLQRCRQIKALLEATAEMARKQAG